VNELLLLLLVTSSVVENGFNLNKYCQTVIVTAIKILHEHKTLNSKASLKGIQTNRITRRKGIKGKKENFFEKEGDKAFVRFALFMRILKIRYESCVPFDYHFFTSQTLSFWGRF
jgi:hypothetical protein